MPEGYLHQSHNGKTYRLYSRTISLNGGRAHRIYYFTNVNKTPKSGEPWNLPAGYHVVCNVRTGLPCIRKNL